MESREVLAQLADQGIRIHRGTLARISDDLGLKTREGTGRRIPRRWSPSQVKVLTAHLHKADLGAFGPLPLNKLADSTGPFPSREVLAHLRGHGFDMHRGTLARISDSLGIPSQESHGRPRFWTFQQVEAILEFLRRRQPEEEERRHQNAQQRRQAEEDQRLERRRRQERRAVEALAKSLLLDTAAELGPDDLRALLEGNPDLTRQLLDQVTGLLRQHLVTTTAETPTQKPRGGRRKEAA